MSTKLLVQPKDIQVNWALATYNEDQVKQHFPEFFDANPDLTSADTFNIDKNVCQCCGSKVVAKNKANIFRIFCMNCKFFFLNDREKQSIFTGIHGMITDEPSVVKDPVTHTPQAVKSWSSRVTASLRRLGLNPWYTIPSVDDAFAVVAAKYRTAK